MELEFLKAFVLICGASAVSIYLLHRIRIPPMVGFIAAGMLIGPQGLGLIEDTHEIEILAEVGVILLLFTVGIEFSLRNLLRMRKAIVFGGGGQIILTIAVTVAISYPLTNNLGISLCYGFLASLSSTAIVLKLLLERGEIDSPHGRNMAGILISQDLCVVPMIFLLPTLSGEIISVVDLSARILGALGIVAAVLISARLLVPRILHQVVHTRSRELFIITVIFMCLGIALLTSRFGLSLALGAFLAGLILSESDYAYQAMSDVIPFKDSFMGLFFVSIGMLIDMRYLVHSWHMILIAVLTILIVKSLIAVASLISISTSPRVAVHAGIGIAQIGEFSFVLAAAARPLGLISDDIYQLLISSAVVTMAITPLMLNVAPRVSIWLSSRKSIRKLEARRKEDVPKGKISDHVIIIGFGFNGRNLAGTLKGMDIPYVVLELNGKTVLDEKKKGQPIHYGDGTSVQILRRLGISRARVLVIAITDPTSSRKAVSVARKENPNIRIIVRTRYLAEVDDLIGLGANEVIPEEFETSVEIFSRVLNAYNVPRNVIDDHIDGIRRNEYMALRTHALRLKPAMESEYFLEGIETETYLVKPQSDIPGHTIRELALRSRTGSTVIAVKRQQKIHQNPSADYVIEENDVLLLVGTKEDINRTINYLDSGAFLTGKYD